MSSGVLSISSRLTWVERINGALKSFECLLVALKTYSTIWKRLSPLPLSLSTYKNYTLQQTHFNSIDQVHIGKAQCLGQYSRAGCITEEWVEFTSLSPQMVITVYRIQDGETSHPSKEFQKLTHCLPGSLYAESHPVPLILYCFRRFGKHMGLRLYIFPTLGPSLGLW